MLISEIFHSIQGEGTLTGVPSVFVRTSGCNLRCNWCDTPYASWNPEGTHMTVGDITRAVAKFPRARHVVLTGGEPMIAPGIHELATALQQLGYHATIETAGTRPPDGIACNLASLSPKLANSAPDDRLDATWRTKHETLRWQPEIIDAWASQYDCQFKFVITREADVTEMEAILTTLKTPIPRHKIMLMPEGVSMDALRRRAGWLSALCKERGYRYAHRLHIELYGDTRGT